MTRSSTAPVLVFLALPVGWGCAGPVPGPGYKEVAAPVDVGQALDFGLDGPVEPTEAPGEAVFVALAGEEGLIVAGRGAPRVRYELELEIEGAWTTIGAMTGGEVWVGEVVEPGTRLRARRSPGYERSPVFVANAWAAAWDEAEDAPALFEGELLELELTLSAAPGIGFGPSSVRVMVVAEDGARYLPEACVESGCWSEEATAWTDASDLSGLPATLSVTLPAPAFALSEVPLVVEVAVHTGEDRVVVASDRRTLLLLGGRWTWGDLHAHSRWSNDGCEDPDNDCLARGDLPAADFFANAADEGLDFAAITDHAEWETFRPEGADGPELAVWDGQAEAVANALTGLVLPLLGYEWTRSSSAWSETHQLGSHRTVLLSDPSACDAYRVAGQIGVDDDWVPELGDWYFSSANNVSALTVAGLWEALDAAAETCEAGVRWLSFAHHPAYERPQVTDWLVDENTPTQERLVEICSEHGCSECADPSAEGCDFGYNEDQVYYPDGSAQTALDQGYQLGFVGGTDSHDSRPGSLGDGPSRVAWWLDSDGDGADDTPARQFGDGAITGALVNGPLSAEALFDSLEARRTVASTGPRPDLRVFARGASGTLYAPGMAIPTTDAPIVLSLTLDAREDERSGASFGRVDLIGTGGELVDGSEELEVAWSWTPEFGDWAYLRLRYQHEDGSEERVWVSPWFAE